MLENLNRYKIILASNSPRRQELLKGLGFHFEVKVLPFVNEDYPDNIPPSQIAEYIACKKADAYRRVMLSDNLIITADTVVIAKGEVLGKPVDVSDAHRMLRCLSGCTHQVVTGVCLTTFEQQRHFSVTTDVTFKQLSDEEIAFYIDRYQPFDKAGAYGIQEWIGYVGVKGIEGSFYTVMGLPVQRLYQLLKTL